MCADLCVEILTLSTRYFYHFTSVFDVVLWCKVATVSAVFFSDVYDEVPRPEAVQRAPLERGAS